MALGSALSIGRSALVNHQTALEVVGNNLANISTPGYHRQEAVIKPASSTQIGPGQFVGRGVQLSHIVRQVNQSLEARLRSGLAQEQAATIDHELLIQLESIQAELTDLDLSSRLNAFFNAWSEVANTPEDLAARTIVTQEAVGIADQMKDMRDQIEQLQTQLDASLAADTVSADSLLSQIEIVNAEIVRAERGQGGANGLRDQRDALLGELAGYLDVSVNEHPSGAIDVFVGSTPLVLNGVSRGLELRQRTINDALEIDLVVKADQTVINPTSGRLGGQMQAREQTVVDALDRLDGFANALIHTVNRLHADGQALAGVTELTSAGRASDPDVRLNEAELGFPVEHGSFQLHLTHAASGQRTTTTIAIDQDGIDPANDTTLTSLAAQLNAIANVEARVTADHRLVIRSESEEIQLSFSDDTSGALAALGINTFFTGKDAQTIAVDPAVLGRPARLTAGQGHVPGDNRNALAIAGLRDKPLSELGGLSLTKAWSREVETLAVRVAHADERAQASGIVRENLQAQQQAISGVNADEEAINLLAIQRAYQGSARFLSVVDDLMQTLLQLV